MAVGFVYKYETFEPRRTCGLILPPVAGQDLLFNFGNSGGGGPNSEHSYASYQVR